MVLETEVEAPSSVRERWTLDPAAYRLVAEIALGALVLIVFTGAAVRLSGSGLGCPDWPKCYGKVAPPLETHAWIEFGNRLISGLVGIAAAAAGLLAWRRRPFRRDLLAIGLLLPLGVMCQAILGGFTVRYHLAPGFVMAHFGLSMLILVAAFALAWRARREPGSLGRLEAAAALPSAQPGAVLSSERTTPSATPDVVRTLDAETITQSAEPDAERWLVRATRALLALGAVTILVGTAATAAGPHAGGAGTDDVIDRLEWRGADTLEWAIHQHGRLAAALGLAALALWLFARRRRATRVGAPLTALCLLLGAQGVVGAVQYELELPAEIVWLHVALGTATWIVLLWTTAAAGSARPRS